MSKCFPRYRDDSDYNTNANSYYEELARKNKLMKELALKIWDYEDILNASLEEIEGILEEMINKIGEGFNDEIEILLREWIEDGSLDHIINETLMNKKADKTELEALDTRLTQEIEKIKEDLEKQNNRIDETVKTSKEEPSTSESIKDSYYHLIDEAKKNEKELLLKDTLRVATFNISEVNKDFFDVSRQTKKEILKTKASVIGTQEMISGQYFDFNRDFTSYFTPYSSFFKNVSDYRFAYGYDYGIGFISSFNILDQQGQHFKMIDKEIEKRGYQRIVVKVNDTKISIYNTHLTHNRQADRDSQMEELFERVEADNNVHRIVLGDYNTREMSELHWFTNKNYSVVNTGQYLTFDGRSAIDNIIVSSNLTIAQSDMVKISKNISDHHILWADIKIK